MNQSFNSELLDRAVEELGKLPGVGRKTALRLALHILRQDEEYAHTLSDAIVNLRDNIQYCSRCHNISESEVCDLCADPHRDVDTICVVENVQDVLTIESTHAYHGLYHVLGGLISPLDGIGPDDIELDSLVNRVQEENISEVILALNPTMEGDTTGFYIYRRLTDKPVKLTILARGVSIGNELEYTDELTLGRSIEGRILFNTTFNSR